MSISKDRSSAFNLQRFYQDLQRVESSLGKGQIRKTITSPLVKTSTKQQKLNTLSTFKKQLNSKQLAKTKINLDVGYQQRINKYQNKVSESKFSNKQGDKQKDGNSYDRIREKLLKWRKEEQQVNNDSIIQLSKVNTKIQKSEQDESIYSDFLQKTIQAPLSPSNNNTLTNQLLGELSKRNDVYQSVNKHCQQEKSYYKKVQIDLSIKLQEHFREHRTMSKVIEQFKRICGLDTSDLKQLYDFLKEGNNKEMKTALGDSQQELI